MYVVSITSDKVKRKKKLNTKEDKNKYISREQAAHNIALPPIYPPTHIFFYVMFFLCGDQSGVIYLSI